MIRAISQPRVHFLLLISFSCLHVSQASLQGSDARQQWHITVVLSMNSRQQQSLAVAFHLRLGLYRIPFFDAIMSPLQTLYLSIMCQLSYLLSFWLSSFQLHDGPNWAYRTPWCSSIFWSCFAKSEPSRCGHATNHSNTEPSVMQHGCSPDWIDYGRDTNRKSSS